MGCNRSVFITGLIAYGPVPNAHGTQGFNFHLKIYKNSDPEREQYANFKVVRKFTNFYKFFFSEPVYLDANLSEVLQVELCDRMSSEVYSNIKAQDLGISLKDQEAIFVEDWISTGAVYRVASGNQYKGSDGVIFTILG